MYKIIMEIYQVKWFSKKKGYGFATDPTGKEYFVHHSDIQVDDGFRYLKQGEYIKGSTEKMDENKEKLASICSPMKNGRLMCEVEKDNKETRRVYSVTNDDDTQV